MAERPEIVLIDGHALAYRQHFAMTRGGRPMNAPDGRVTNATFGFTQAILNYLSEKPQYIAVTFDRGLSGREKIYRQYKQNRADVPPDLVQQLNDMEAIVRAFNIPILVMDDYEADDVIGTIAAQAEAQGCKVRIITGDRDILQLLTENVTVQIPPAPNPKAKSDGDKVWTVENFSEGWEGLVPRQIIDYKGLNGDSSDNIPGVGGIGDKTAKKLLLQFGTLEDLYNNLDKLSAKERQKLVEGREIAFLSRELATIMRDVPIQLDLAACHTHDFDFKAVLKIFDELGFGENSRKRLRGLLDEKQQAEFDKKPILPETPFFPEHTVVLEKTQLDALVEVLNQAEHISFDTETTSIDKMNAALVGISLAVNGEHGYYIPVGHRSPNQQPSLFGGNDDPAQLPLPEVLDALRPALTNPTIPKIAHNALYDVIILRRYGIEVAPVTEDTMIKAWIIDPSENIGLKDLAGKYLHLKMQEIHELIGTGKKQITMDRVAIDQAAAYAAADAVVTYRLLQRLNEKIEPHMQELYEQLEMPLIPILADMEIAGIMIDQPYLAELSKELNRRMQAYEQVIHELAGEKFNVNSPKELNRILFDKLKLPTEGLRKTQTTGFSVDAATLEELAERWEDDYPILREIMAYRSLAKLIGTYVDAMPAQADAKSRVHTSYNQTGAITGRLSSSNPNLQNIPIRTEEGRRVRKAFIASAGHVLMSVDYSQFELRILAHYSGDETLKRAFAEGQDIHRTTAAKVFNIEADKVTSEQRRFAKTINFGLMYGMGAFRLARDTELTLKEAERFREAYFNNFPAVKDYLDGTKAFVIENGYAQTLFGRRRYFEVQINKATGEKRITERTGREAINMPIQGTNADIMKKAMIALHKALKEGHYKTRILLQVHDELVLEVPENEVETLRPLTIQTLVEAGNILDVPVIAEAKVGKNWDEMK